MSSISVPQLASTRIDVPLNRPLRVAGLFYAIYGLAALGKLMSSPVGFGLAGAILMLFSLFGLYLVLSVHSFSVSSGQYVVTSGVWPFVHRQAGSISEVASVRVENENPAQTDGQAQKALVLTWSDGRPPLELQRAGSSNAKFEELSTAIGSALGRPVIRRSAESDSR